MTKNRMYTSVILLLAVVCGQPVRSEQMAFPGTDWEDATPESQSVDSAKLGAAVDYLRDHSGSNGVKRLIIVRNGRAIWQGFDVDRRQRVWSVTKAFTSTAQGLLIEDVGLAIQSERPNRILSQRYAPPLRDDDIRL